MPQRAMKAISSPWEVVELQHFCVPDYTQASQWQRRGRAASSWLTGKRSAAQQAKEERELRKLPEVKLAHLVPHIDWSQGANAFDQALQHNDLKDEPLVLFITPPHGGHADILSQWAEQQRVSCLAVPTYQELSNASLDWIQHCENQRRWVLPALERCFLRHSQGLQGVREFLERALSGHLGRGVIGCDSWAYAYLQHAVGLEGIPVLTLQAMQGEQLATYFAEMANSGPGCPVVYSTRTGKPILAGDSGQTAKESPVHKELQRLAAHCRGHLGIAWHYWRERLREPAEGSDADADAELWLLDALADAELPADTGDIATLVLHALLLHGGLEDQTLGDVLPFTHHEALNARLALARQGILSCHEGRWQIAPLSYTSVRQLLMTRSYLVDPL